MSLLPDHSSQSARVGTGATPTITLAAPGPTVAYVIRGVRTRMVNAGAGNYALVLQITDSVLGVIFSWEIATNAAAGTIDVDDFESDDLGIQCSPGASVTISWNGPAPAGGNSGGMITTTFNVAG